MKLLALDIGAKRIGVATANTDTPIAIPRLTIEVKDDRPEETYQNLAKLLEEQQVEKLVVGLPRNSKGEETKQSDFVRNFIDDFTNKQSLKIPVEYQDESLTSVIAEEYLKTSGKPYAKSDIDAQAAALILTDYLESNHG